VFLLEIRKKVKNGLYPPLTVGKNDQGCSVGVIKDLIPITFDSQIGQRFHRNPQPFFRTVPLTDLGCRVRLQLQGEDFTVVGLESDCGGKQMEHEKIFRTMHLARTK